MTWLLGTFTTFVLYTIWGITTLFLAYIGLWLLFASRKKPRHDKDWKDYQTKESVLTISEDEKEITALEVHDWKYSIGQDPVTTNFIIVGGPKGIWSDGVLST